MYNDNFAFYKILTSNSKKDNKFNHVITSEQRVAGTHVIIFGCD